MKAHQIFYSDDTLQHRLSVRIISFMVHDPWTVDEEDLLHEGDVLPDLCLSRDGRNFTNLQHPAVHEKHSLVYECPFQL